ncbi:MAG: hypothetical protein ABEK01_05335 [Candidatus Nanohaloarchaea archaeon]
MTRLYLESDGPDALEEEFMEKIEEETRDHAGYSILEFDYEVDGDEHLLYVDLQKGPKATGSPGSAPEFHVLEAESQEDLSDMVDELEEPEWRGRKMRKRNVGESSYAAEDDAHYQAVTVETGPWLS